MNLDSFKAIYRRTARLLGYRSGSSELSGNSGWRGETDN